MLANNSSHNQLAKTLSLRERGNKNIDRKSSTDKTLQDIQASFVPQQRTGGRRRLTALLVSVKTSGTQPPLADDMERFVVSHDWSNSFSFQFFCFFFEERRIYEKNYQTKQMEVNCLYRCPDTIFCVYFYHV